MAVSTGFAEPVPPHWSWSLVVGPGPRSLFRVVASLGSQDLRALGELSTQVLAETKIGLAVNRLSKEAGDEVRDMAKCLVQDWKQLHRKRKGTEVSESPKKAARPEAVATPKKAAARVKVLEKLQDALKEAALRFGRAAVDGLAEQPTRSYIGSSHSSSRRNCT
eukprot:g24298.t1